MLKIGSAWNRTSQQGKNYKSIIISKEAAPLIASGDYYFSMHPVNGKTSPEAPDDAIYATSKEEQNQNKNQGQRV